MLYDLTQRRPWSDICGRSAVHLCKTVVGNDHALFGIEHRKALEHVRQGWVQLAVLRPQVFLLARDQPALTLDAICSSSPRSQIPNGRDLHPRNARAKNSSRDLDRDPLSCGSAKIGFPSVRIARNEVQQLSNWQTAQYLQWPLTQLKSKPVDADKHTVLHKREGFVVTRHIQRVPRLARDEAPFSQKRNSADWCRISPVHAQLD